MQPPLIPTPSHPSPSPRLPLLLVLVLALLAADTLHAFLLPNRAPTPLAAARPRHPEGTAAGL